MFARELIRSFGSRPVHRFSTRRQRLALHFGRSATILAASSLCLSGLAGCGKETSDSGRLPVSGTVTRGTKPLAKGSIQFHSKATPGQGEAVLVQDGRFEMQASRGLIPGEYEAEILDAPGEEGTTPAGITIDPITGAEVPTVPTGRAGSKGSAKALYKAAAARRNPRRTIQIEANGPNTFEFNLPD